MASSTLRSDAPCPFQSALLLTDEENKVFADRTALRNAGVRHFRVLTSGVEAAQYLAERVSTIIYPVTEVIVCLPDLIDMNQAEFASLVRSHPLLPHMPLLAVISHRGNEALLRKAGYDAVLPRPFNTNTLSAVLHTLANTSRQTRATLIETLKRDRAVPDHSQFKSQLKRYIPPDKDRMTGAECCQYGKQLLQAQHLDRALPYLQKATTDPASKAEACLALAVLWKDKRDYDKVKVCLFSALKAFMDTGAWPQAMALTKKLVKEYPSVPHPLLHELERRLRQSKVVEAVAMLAHVHGALPYADTAPTLLRGTQATSEPETSLAELLDIMEHSGHPEVLALRDELLGLMPSEEPTKKRWFNRLLSRNDATASGNTTKNAGQASAKSSAESSAESPTGAPQAETLAEGRPVALVAALDQSLLSIPADFSLVDDEVIKSKGRGVELAEERPRAPMPELVSEDNDLADNNPPPLIMSVPENYAKTEPLLDEKKRGAGRAKSARPVNPTHGEAVLPLIGEEDAHIENGLRPSLLGDAWTMIRGTMRLYRSSK